VATAGFEVVILGGLTKVGFGIVYSPVIGVTGGALLMFALIWALHRTRPEMVSSIFGRAQLLSSAYMAFSHGSNDGQKTMGILSLSLFTYGALGSTFYVPLPIMIASAIAMGLGTAMGGWRIIRTMGTRMVQLQPVHGFAAETAAGTLIEVATRSGIPISTTHAISGAILGVGTLRGVRNVRWSVVTEIVTAWVLTIPACFALGWLLMQVGTRLTALIQH
jgi:inorganic phosphate transporter, PiT family